MGLINFGVPEKETEYLKKSLNLDVFVEGGTYEGGTAKSMSSKFEKVYTIEKSETMFDIAKNNLKGISNITILKGDTRKHLKGILKENNNILFWLDAHWSGGKTYGEEDECPLIEELEIIFQSTRNYIILVDDARLFLAPPPSPHNYKKWPSLNEILETLPKNWELIVFEDVIYLFPKKIADGFKTFMQELTTDRWKQYGKDIQNSFIKGIKIATLGLMKGKVV
jgi:hypothetical protein